MSSKVVSDSPPHLCVLTHPSCSARVKPPSSGTLLGTAARWRLLFISDTLAVVISAELVRLNAGT